MLLAANVSAACKYERRTRTIHSDDKSYSRQVAVWTLWRGRGSGAAHSGRLTPEHTTNTQPTETLPLALRARAPPLSSLSHLDLDVGYESADDASARPPHRRQTNMPNERDSATFVASTRCLKQLRVELQLSRWSAASCGNRPLLSSCTVSALALGLRPSPSPRLW